MYTWFISDIITKQSSVEIRQVVGPDFYTVLPGSFDKDWIIIPCWDS